MSRSGYGPETDCNWVWIRWRGAVKSAIRGRRGQAFLREMQAALDAMPRRRLIAGMLEDEGEYCALGAVGHARGMDLSRRDYSEEETAAMFGISQALAAEIMSVNDHDVIHGYEDDMNGDAEEARFNRVWRWVQRHLIP